MKKTLLLFLLIPQVFHLAAWGFYGHRRINEIAVFTLPKPLFAFYKQHVSYLVAHATDADSRRYVQPEEACRHYLDGDHYESALPLDTLPRRYRDACAKYGEDSVLAHGIVPWHVQLMLHRLTLAFQEKDITKILKISADLGHYTGDLHVPLHATSNYNGQKTGQKGIHALWESRLPELFSADYDFFTGLAEYCPDPGEAGWKAFEASFGLTDSVLKTERRVAAGFTDDTRYSWEPRGNVIVRVYSKDFCSAYHRALGSMVEDRMRASIVLLGSFWYTAWVNAGQPDLEGLPAPPAGPEEQLPATGVMIGRGEED